MLWLLNYILGRANEYYNINAVAYVEKHTLELMTFLMIGSALVCAVVMFVYKHRASYGRYTDESSVYAVDARLGWFIQESPSFFVAVMALFRTSYTNDKWIGYTAVVMFTLHYAQRFLYPLLIRGNKRTMPVHLMCMAFIFTLGNGYMQGHYHALYAQYSHSDNAHTMRLIGVALFFVGAAINIHSDHILRNLRTTPEDKSYKIPKGGMFEFVSGANFFGEIVEWFGFALYCQTLTSLAFALFTFANTAPRAIEHHKWYIKKFDTYPKNRKAVIPFLL